MAAKGKDRAQHGLNRVIGTKRVVGTYRQAKLDWLQKLRTETPCTDCGRNYPSYVMEFDHVKEKRSKKQGMAAFAASRGWDTLRAEVAKCELVCANCHKVRTFTRKEHLGGARWHQAQGHEMESTGRNCLGEQV